jgi:hypothetical protein
METCFPDGGWFGVGLDGTSMPEAELVFFMSPGDLSKSRKVISTRSGKPRSGKPVYFPEDSPIYQTTVKSCGVGMSQFNTKRPLDSKGL